MSPAEHLNVLESDLADRNSLIKASQDEIRRLRDENDERKSEPSRLPDSTRAHV